MQFYPSVGQMKYCSFLSELVMLLFLLANWSFCVWLPLCMSIYKSIYKVLFFFFSSSWHSQTVSSSWPHYGMMDFLAGVVVTGQLSWSCVSLSACSSLSSRWSTFWLPKARWGSSSKNPSLNLSATQPPTSPSSSSSSWPHSTQHAPTYTYRALRPLWWSG